MSHWYFIIPIITISYGVILLCGLIIGLRYRDLRDWVQQLHEDNETRKADEADHGSAVIETTPKTIEAKRRRGELPSNDDEESAIVTVKSPRQLAEERDAKIKAELDEIQGHSSRIGP